jgi:hypothetical protein
MVFNLLLFIATWRMKQIFSPKNDNRPLKGDYVAVDDEGTDYESNPHSYEEESQPDRSNSVVSAIEDDSREKVRSISVA